MTLQTVGGKDTIDTIRRILHRMVSNNLAISYNWTGRNNKNNFSVLKNVINLILGKCLKYIHVQGGHTKIVASPFFFFIIQDTKEVKE